LRAGAGRAGSSALGRPAGRAEADFSRTGLAPQISSRW
jgi:hypothetical protein